MRLEQLLYLEEIAKHRSINAASAQLHMTQQSLSNSVQSLEQELGTTILNRTHRGVSLTSDGQKVLQTARAIIEQWGALKEELTASNRQSSHSPLRILSTFRVASNVLAKYINAFAHKYPHIPIICENENTTNILEQYEHFSNCDLIFASLSFNKTTCLISLPPGVSFYPLIQHKLLLFVNKHSELAKLSSISTDKLRSLPLRTYNPPEQIESQEEIFWEFYHQLNLGGNLQYSDSISYCLQGVLDDVFCVLCTEGTQSAIFTHPETTAIPIKMDLYIASGYLLPNDAALSDKAQRFIDLML